MEKNAAGLLLLAGLVSFAGLPACDTATAPSGPRTFRSVADFPPAGPTAGGAIAQTAEDFPFPRILCFGDSLTLGTDTRERYGSSVLAPMEGYVPKLARLLSDEHGGGIELINSGISGETTTEGLERLSWEVRLYRPDLVLLLEGVVDVNNDEPTFAKARNNLNGMVEVVLRHGSAIVVGTTPPLNPEGFRIWGIGNVPRLNNIIRQEARKLGVPVADHEQAFGDDMSLQGPDGLHPNDNGYRRMAETWFQAVEELVAQ